MLVPLPPMRCTQPRPLLPSSAYLKSSAFRVKRQASRESTGEEIRHLGIFVHRCPTHCRQVLRQLLINRAPTSVSSSTNARARLLLSSSGSGSGASGSAPSFSVIVKNPTVILRIKICRWIIGDVPALAFESPKMIVSLDPSSFPSSLFIGVIVISVDLEVALLQESSEWYEL